MNREIKFRQKVKQGWHYWGMIKGVWISPRLDSEAETVSKSQQFIGLKSKLGVEIYEGDILTNNWVVDYQEVEGLEQLFKRDIAPNCIGFVIPMDYKDREVIGNVWENPELLKT